MASQNYVVLSFQLKFYYSRKFHLSSLKSFKFLKFKRLWEPFIVSSDKSFFLCFLFVRYLHILLVHLWATVRNLGGAFVGIFNFRWALDISDICNDNQSLSSLPFTGLKLEIAWLALAYPGFLNGGANRKSQAMTSYKFSKEGSFYGTKIP